MPLSSVDNNDIKINGQHGDKKVSDITETGDAKHFAGNTKLSDIVGHDDIIQRLKDRFIDYYAYKEEMLSYGYEPSRGTLLYGIPGVGKTMIIRGVINELLSNNSHVKYMKLDINEFMATGVGESAEKIHSFFNRIRIANATYHREFILIIDEIDALVPKRGKTRSVLTLERVSTILDEIGGLNDDNNMYIIGTTNRPQDIDSAFLRNGRMDKLEYVSAPDLIARKKLIIKYLRPIKMGITLDLNNVAEQTNGYTGSDFMGLGRELFLLSKKGKIDIDRFYQILKDVHIDLNKNMLEIAAFEAMYDKMENGTLVMGHNRA